MAHQKRIRLRCDMCGVLSGAEADSIRQARRAAHTQGNWKSIRAKSRKGQHKKRRDLCPTCYAVWSGWQARKDE